MKFYIVEQLDKLDKLSIKYTMLKCYLEERKTQQTLDYNAYLNKQVILKEKEQEDDLQVTKKNLF